MVMSCHRGIADGLRLFSSRLLTPSTVPERSIIGRSVIANHPRARISDSYDIGRVVGSGVRGTVSIAKAKRNGRSCALKVVKVRGSRDSRAAVREAATHAELDHPHIARVYESFLSRSRYCMALELCTGGDLFEALEKQGFFRERDAHHVFKQIMSAVCYLHNSNFAHRDLKLENCLLTKKGVPLSSNDVKIIDCDMMTRFTTGVPSMTTLVGSPCYTAPEVFSGRYDEKCDVFSCGVMLYCMLCGRLPFKSDDDARVASVAFEPDDLASVSAAAVSLMRGTCARQAVSRPSSSEVLDSAWLLGSGAPSAPRLPASEIVESLGSFSRLTEVQREALCHVAYNVDDVEFPDIREAFKRVDSNSDGKLARKELLALSSSSAREAPLSDEVPPVGEAMGYTEFLAAMLHRRELPEAACRAAFGALDHDDDGAVCADDIVGASASGDATPPETSQGEGALSFADFRAMLGPKSSGSRSGPRRVRHGGA